MEFELLKILTFKDIEKAKELVGQNVFCTNNVENFILEKVEYAFPLEKVRKFCDRPFKVCGSWWNYIYPEKTNKQI